jgi:hypothetical protein
MVILLAVAALAHPFQPSAWSMRTSIKAEADTLHVVVALEAPTFVVLRSLVEETGATTSGFNKAKVEKARDAYNDATWDSLAGGLSVSVDGAPVPMNFEAVDSPINGRANDQFFLYLVESTWTLPPSTQPVTITVQNTAYLDEDMYLTAQPIARAPWLIDDANSLLLLRMGECLPEDEAVDESTGEIDDKGEVWLRDARLRTLSVVFTPG